MSAWPVFVCSTRALRMLAAALLLPVSLPAQNAKTGAVTCATCHAGVVAAYAHAPMRHAMEPERANPALAAHPDLKVQQGSYSYSVQTKDGKSTYSVTDGTRTLTLPIRWNIGQHAQTWVLEKDGHMYESLVSFFPRIDSGKGGLGTTPGDQRITPHTLEEAMGRELPIWESRACFRCHASGLKDVEPLEPARLQPGVECEHCHANAQQHMADAQNGEFRSRPPSLKKISAEGVSNFCGECHRSWDTVLRNNWHGAPFVRFQPYRLALSQCFTGNDPRISCIACHNPHQAVNHDAKFYDSKCLACHGEPAHVVASTKTAPPPMAPSCPVAKENCASCHMPKVDLPGGNAQFTDHYIRIVKPGEAYPY